MIKKILIAEKPPLGKVFEYVIAIDDQATNDDYCDLAWEYALDEFAIDPNRRRHYRFIVSDHHAN